MFELFIARRILKNRSAERKVARPILRISVGAIALGILIMILSVSTGNGLRKAIQNKVTGFGGDIQVLNYQPSPSYEQVPLVLSDSLQKELLSWSEITHLQPYARKAGIIKNAKLFEGGIIKGVDENYRWDFFRQYLLEGRIPKFGGQSYQDSILMSADLARKLDFQLGDECAMYFVRPNRPPLRRKFTIGAIFQTDFEEIDESFLIGDLKHVQRLSDWEDEEVGAYEVFLNPDANADLVSAKLRAVLPFEYDALSARSLNVQLFQWLDLFDLNIVIILVIIILVATVNISIALLILIMERTNMIGLLKALGAADFSIQKIFLLNAAYLILQGLALGNILALSLLITQDRFGWLKLDPKTYYVSEVSVDLNLWPILAVNLLTLIICLLSLLLPSFLISRISPRKAIRFD